MLCCVCKKKEATVHLTQIAGEKMQKVDLCEDCAKEKGIQDVAGGYSLADLDVLLGLGAAQEMEEAAGGSELRCPQCGFTQADFKKAGRLGCAQCYETFAEGLEALLKTMHKGTRHKGKTPLAQRGSQDVREKLASLQKRLDKAVAEENFEQAAQVRDEIKAAKARLTEMSA
jgi:protein arginine kinase activator